MLSLTRPGLLLLALLLPACAAHSRRHQLETLPLAPPAAFNADSSRVQRLSVARLSGGPQLTIEAAVELDRQELRVAGFYLAQRILLLVWDGRNLQELRDPVVPKMLSGRSILRDLQFVYLPAEYLRAWMPAGLRLEEESGARQLYAGKTLLLESVRLDTTPLGAAKLINHADGYSIDIQADDSER